MREVDLSVSLAGLKLANPTMLASGILGYSSATLAEVERNGAGAVVTKSVCLKPREGYANPTIVETDCGLINAMGLPNPGINEFTKEIKEIKSSLKVPVIVSVFGFSVNEYVTASKKAMAAGADAIELNVSCPHVAKTGSEMGQDPELLSQIVSKVKSSVESPVFAKLSPNVTDIVDIARSAEDAGADALTIMNTVRALAIDVETQIPILANTVGGLSGPHVKPIALRNIYEVFERVHVPIIGCGGISNWRDAVEFLLAGASALQIGTAVATVGTRIFSDVALGLRVYLMKKNYGRVDEIVGLAHKNR